MTEPLRCNLCLRPAVPIIHEPEGINLCGKCSKKWDKTPEMVKAEAVKRFKSEKDV